MNRGKRILFASWHSLIDSCSGAAISAWDILDALPRRNWKVRSFSGPQLDGESRIAIEQLLIDRGILLQVEHLRFHKTFCKTIGYRTNMITGLSFVPEEPISESEPAYAAFMKIFKEIVEKWKPDVLLTYGGHSFMPGLFQYAKKQGMKTVFLLANLAYRHVKLFESIDTVVVPSNFSKEYYENHLGLSCEAIPCLMKSETVLAKASPSERRYVTLINPQPHKGLFLFVRLAEVLARLRPEIPLLVVEGRGGASFLGRTGIDMSGIRNISIMPNTSYPVDYYEKSRIVLMPSLCTETFGRVAAEAMMNGIPVIASDRGALPEICGQAGIVLDIPGIYTSESRIIVTERDVMPWVETISRLWDDDEYYATVAERCRTWSKRWDEETVLDLYDRCFRE